MKAVVLLLALAAGVLIALRLHHATPAKPAGAAAVDGKDGPELRPNDTGSPAAAVATGGAKKPKPTALSAEKRRELVQLAAAGTRVRAADATNAAGAGGGSAEADGADDLTPEQHKEQARMIFDQAQDFFMAKQYLDAADAFLEAYGDFPSPTFVYNAAVSYAKAHLCDDAVSLFARYQAEDPYQERHHASDTGSLAYSMEKCEAYAAMPPPDAP